MSDATKEERPTRHLKVDDGHWILVDSYGRRLLGRMTHKPAPRTPEMGASFNTATLDPCYEVSIQSEQLGDGAQSFGLVALPFMLLGMSVPVEVRWSSLVYVHELGPGDLDLIKKIVRAAEGHKASFRAARSPLVLPG